MTERQLLVPDDKYEELLFEYTNDFTALAKKGRFDPITGRDAEIEEVILILLQKNRKNACMLAPAGVGKTALVVGLAQQVVAGNVPEYLKDCKVIELDMARMAAGTDSAAEFQGRFIPICKGMAERYHYEEYPKTVMFIDEVHTIMPSCRGSAYAGLSEVMKPYMTMGDLHILGATTLDEYRIYVAEDPALDRRFQKVHLKVPSDPETVQIMHALRPGFEKHHHVKIPDELLERVVMLTTKHLRKRNQPDKAIIMLDAACAYHVRHHGRDTTLEKYSLHFMISRECGVHPDAMDETKDTVSTPTGH